MSMRINTKYALATDNWKVRFYTSRFLRLFPLYWAVCILAMLFWFVTKFSGPNLIHNGNELSVLSQAALILSNASIVGLDAVVILQDHLSGNIMRLIGPAWSLAIEIQFYLVAPFVVTRSLRTMLLLLGATLAIRFSLLGATYDPWRYYFAPSVWCFFIMGATSFKLIAFVLNDTTRRALGWAGLLGIVPLGVICGIRDMSELDTPSMWVFYLGRSASVPFIFELTKEWKRDRRIGEFSYPMYIVHPLGLVFLSYYFGAQLNWPTKIVIVLAASVLVHYCVEYLVNRIRKKFRQPPPTKPHKRAMPTSEAANPLLA
jgi:peptidoglycan/LPS O-acetylase OafA/YrhL